MARGWECKAIEDQIEDEESRQQQASRVDATPEQRMLREQLDSLKPNELEKSWRDPTKTVV